MYLHENESLDSKLLKKFYVVTFICEDDNNFKIKANDDDDNYLFHFRLCDYVNMKEKDFIYKINNFKLLLETVEKAVNENSVTLCNIGGNLKITFYYTIIYEKKKISFELHEQLSDKEEIELIVKFELESEEIDETKNNIDYRAEIVNYNKDFEDYGDRNIIRATIRNTGTTSWEKEIASLRCVPEFSSLLCKEYIFEDEVIPGEDVEIALEFLKNEKKNLEPPYYTCMHLHIHPQNYDPMLVFDFNNTFTNEDVELELPDIKFEEKNDDDNNENDDNNNKNSIKNDDDDNNNKNSIKNDDDDNKNKNNIQDDKKNKNSIKNDDDNKNNNIIKNDDDNKNKNSIKNDDDNKNKNSIQDDDDKKNKKSIQDDDDDKKNKNNIQDDDKKNKNSIKNDDDNKNNNKRDAKKEDSIEVNKPKKIDKKAVSQKNAKNDVDDDEEEKLKKMTPFQRRIYELNKRENKRIKKEKEKENKVGWKKKFA